MPESSSPPHSPRLQLLQGLHKQPQSRTLIEPAVHNNYGMPLHSLDSTISFGRLTDQTLFVKLLYALPFLFRKELPVLKSKPEAPQHPDLQELGEILEDMHAQSQYNMLSVPTLGNRLIHLHHHLGLAAALAPLPISSEGIKLALTLISALYPSVYGWNRPDLSLTSLITPTIPMPASEFTFKMNRDYLYETTRDYVLITNGEDSRIYSNIAHIPPSEPTYSPKEYPYGWSPHIEDFCKDSGHHPDCVDPIQRAFIERAFIAHTINNPEHLLILDHYIQIIHTNYTGKTLQWLKSSSTQVLDNLQERLDYFKFYNNVHQQGGQVLHSKKGLRITIPEENWINWKNYSPTSQQAFTRVAWAQLTQFDKLAFMTSLHGGKLDDIPIYFDFEDDAKHDQFWNTELSSIRQYYIELITRSGAYNFYNQFVIQELANFNEPLELSQLGDWDVEGRPTFIFLPYSQLILRWKSTLNKWTYETHSADSLSPASMRSFSPTSIHSSDSYNSDTDSSASSYYDKIPSLEDSIDEFELE